LIDDQTRLKAEVERSRDQYNGIIDTQLAEIERLNSELFTCSCANANMHKYKNENARLKAEVERLTAFTTRTIIPNEKLKAEVKRLKDSKLKRRKRGRTIL
jgi:hypothetical protein